MDGQPKEISKTDMLRGRIGKITELISVGKTTRNLVKEHPLSTIAGMVLLGFLTAVFSGGIIRLFINLISFGMRVAAFIFVAKQTLSKISNFFKSKKEKETE